MKRLLCLLGLATLALMAGWPTATLAWTSRGTNCYGTLPCPHWSGITVHTNIPGVGWRLSCSPGPYTCEGIIGNGSRDVASAECTNGNCAAAGQDMVIAITGTNPAYTCTGNTQTVQRYTPEIFHAPYWADVQMYLTCNPVITPTPTPFVTPTPTPSSTPTNSPPEGNLDSVSCTDGIAGWSYDPDYAGAVSVHIYKDGVHMNTLTAVAARPDVALAHPGRGNTGFSMVFPETWKDGATHNIAAYGINVDASGTLSGISPHLIGSPKNIVCAAPLAPLKVTPSQQTVPPNVSAVLHASGGTGEYSWYAPSGSPEYGTGIDFGTVYTNATAAPVTKTVYVTSGTMNASAIVTVTEISTFSDDIMGPLVDVSPSPPIFSPPISPSIMPPSPSPPIFSPPISPSIMPPSPSPSLSETPPVIAFPPIGRPTSGFTDIIGMLSIASAAAVGISAIAAILQIFSGAGAVAFLWQSLMGIIGLLPARKKVWGTVYDSNTKRPIPFAKVQLLDKNKRVLETRIADKDGRYGFLTTPETLMAQNIQIALLPHSKDYAFPSHTAPTVDSLIYSNLYYGDLITVNDKTLINYDIPMDPLHPSAAPLVVKSPSIALGATVAAVADAGFWLGVVMVPLNFILNPSPFTLAILFLFFGTASLRIWGINEHPFGVVKDSQTGRPMPFALITLKDMSGRRVAFTVSDERGRYFLVIEKGTYEITLFTPATVVPTRQVKHTISAKKGWITREMKV